MVIEFVNAFWATTVKMAPWLLFGFLAAGLLSLFFTAEFVNRHLGRKAGLKAILTSVCLGVPLPLCSCGVLPVAVGLRKGGASKGATAAFLISTPQTGIDSFFATYSLLGWAFALFRPIVALLSGLVGGFWVDALDREAPHPAATAKDLTATGPFYKRLPAAIAYGYGTLMGGIAPALTVGLLISALITIFVPADFFAGSVMGSDWIAFPVMLLIGMPMYVCSTASIPVALALMAKGISPGAALIFLIVGPALNGASLTTLLKLLGTTCTLIHLSVIASSAILAGLLLNALNAHTALVPNFAAPLCDGTCAAPTPLWQTLCAATLLALLTYSLILKPLRRKMMTTATPATTGQHVTVKGMMCDHCRATVMKLLKSYPTVTAVTQATPDTFHVEGTLPDTLAADIAEAGFELTP